tara:strand:- start:41 stop:451 length:411 start_codon:yes stop_codon:yes gene_type:complete
MPEGILSISDQFTGAGKTLNYYKAKHGTFVGAASGSIILTTAFQTCLEFTTGTEVIIADVEYGIDWDTAGASFIDLKVEMNGATVYFDSVRRDVVKFRTNQPSFVIAPLTTFTVSMLNSDANSTPATVILAGRSYE